MQVVYLIVQVFTIIKLNFRYFGDGKLVYRIVLYNTALLSESNPYIFSARVPVLFLSQIKQNKKDWHDIPVRKELKESEKDYNSTHSEISRET